MCIAWLSLTKCVSHWPFCPGVFIAILALLAAIVAFREPGRIEKAVWTLLFLALMIAEVAMMGIDRQKAEDHQKQADQEQLIGFKQTGDEIQGAIKASEKHFNETMAKYKALTDLETGGNSYCTFDVRIYDNDDGKGEQARLFLVHHGDLNVRFLQYKVVDLVSLSSRSDARPLCVPNTDEEVMSLSVNGDSKDIFVHITSVNGIWDETIMNRRVNKVWEQAIRLEKRTVGSHSKQITETISDKFPRTFRGEMEWAH